MQENRNMETTISQSIQIYGKRGEFVNVQIARLKAKTSYVDEPGDTLADLLGHVVDCFPHDSWRLVDSTGAIISEHEGD